MIDFHHHPWFHGRNTDVSDPGVYRAPTPAEFAEFLLLAVNFPSTPGNAFITLRNAPSISANPGLDAPPPGPLDEAQIDEVGAVPLPTPSHDCPDSTAVTITRSAFDIVMTDRTPGNFGGFGVGTSIMETRDLTPAASITAAMLAIGAPINPGIPFVVGETVFPTTFADLPFFSMENWHFLRCSGNTAT